MMFLAVPGLLVMAPGVYATPVSIKDWVKLNRVGTVGGAGGRGEFSVHKTDGNPGTFLFETFCVERDE